MLRRSKQERLHEYQAEILTILTDKEPLIAASAAPEVVSLAKARWTLMRALTAYALFKENEVFGPLIAKASPSDAHGLLRMKRACQELSDDFRAYVQRWSASDVAARWTDYQPAARAMVARIRAHIARERTALAAVLRKEA